MKDSEKNQLDFGDVDAIIMYLESKWNAEADEANSWDNLGTNECLKFFIELYFPKFPKRFLAFLETAKIEKEKIIERQREEEIKRWEEAVSFKFPRVKK
jgi:hypothetical protein